MVQIDRSNTTLVGLDLHTVAKRHQAGLVEAIEGANQILEIQFLLGKD